MVFSLQYGVLDLLIHEKIPETKFFGCTSDWKCKSCLMDGWMTCDFTSFITVFQSYQDDVRIVMKGCVQWNG